MSASGSTSPPLDASQNASVNQPISAEINSAAALPSATLTLHEAPGTDRESSDKRSLSSTEKEKSVAKKQKVDSDEDKRQGVVSGREKRHNQRSSSFNTPKSSPSTGAIGRPRRKTTTDEPTDPCQLFRALFSHPIQASGPPLVSFDGPIPEGGTVPQTAALPVPGATGSGLPLGVNPGGEGSAASKKRWDNLRVIYDKFKSRAKNLLHKLSPRRLLTPTVKVDVNTGAIGPTPVPVGGGDGTSSSRLGVAGSTRSTA
ncbi:hypothetical protein GQ53DRAFT_858888 [Thozetella sp. PMI_491]|nr:hypothetical protein GQ53DRAFT_858888 [Thozetella sp. PMI_491]